MKHKSSLSYFRDKACPTLCRRCVLFGSLIVKRSRGHYDVAYRIDYTVAWMAVIYLLTMTLFHPSHTVL